MYSIDVSTNVHTSSCNNSIDIAIKPKAKESLQKAVTLLLHFLSNNHLAYSSMTYYHRIYYIVTCYATEDTQFGLLIRFIYKLAQSVITLYYIYTNTRQTLK
jgi:hypothetical protein